MRTFLLFFLFISTSGKLFPQSPGIQWIKNKISLDDWYSGELVYDIKATADGGFVMVGSDTSGYGYEKKRALNKEHGAGLLLVKADKDGKILWKKNFGDRHYEEFYPYVYGTFLTSVQQLNDGGFICSGVRWDREHIQTDFFILRIDRDGNKIWEKTYGGSKNDFGQSITIADDGQFVIAGYTKSGDGDVSSNHQSRPK